MAFGTRRNKYLFYLSHRLISVSYIVNVRTHLSGTVVIHTIKRGDLIALVNKAQNGDRDAFSQLYHDYRSVLLTLALPRVGHFAAEDVVQEAFSLAFRHLRKLRDPVGFGPWVAQITRNCCWKWLAKQPRDHIPIDEPDIEFLVNYSLHQTSLTPIEVADMRMDLTAILGELPERYALPLRLHYLDQLTATEVAVLTGVPVSTVKWRIHRSLEICRLIALRRNTANQCEHTQGGVGRD